MLRIAFVLAWLPALASAAYVARNLPASMVVSGAGRGGAIAGIGLIVTLSILTAAYLAALRWPPATTVLLTSLAGSLAAALAMPLLFSADVYAYAYYGDALLRGVNPYAHAAPAIADPLAAAAMRAWNGSVPPRCVYGPVAVGVAAVADLAGAAGGAAAQLFAQRLTAVIAYAGYTACVLRIVPDARRRAAFVLHPTVLWSVAEGHNDAAMLACILAGWCFPTRWVLLTLGALVKIPAIAVFGHISGARGRTLAVMTTVAGYFPLAVALAHAGPLPGAALPAGWQSPLGVAAAVIGRLPALAGALVFLAGCGLALRNAQPSERTSALALAAWFTLPNAYPWYALWIVPLAARNLASPWSAALLVAASCAPVRAVLDAVYPAADRSPSPAFHGPMIALEFVPPLLCAVALTWRARRIGATIAILALAATLPVPAFAQAAAAPSATPTAAATSTAAPAATATSTAAPSATAGPSAAAPGALAAPPVAARPVAAPPLPAPTLNPFAYVITPPPVSTVSPDGPHILQIELNDRRIRAGGPLIVRVMTSPNVVGVEARTLGRFIPIPQSSPGLFALAYTMPDAIPFWLLNRKYDIVIAAATADGRQISISFPMLLVR